MKNIKFKPIIMSILLGICFIAYPQKKDKSSPFPKDIDCKSTNVYRYCKDGKAGREVVLSFAGTKILNDVEVEIEAEGRKEITNITSKSGLATVNALLPSDVGVEKDVTINVTIKSGKNIIKKSFTLPKQRKWTVYIYPHSHVDIGYTNTHENVEIIHKRNLVNGMKLAKETASYPEGARYIWNPEVIWPLERYMKKASPSEKSEMIDAIKKGYICLDAGYINDNTSVTADEEFPSFFGEAKKYEKETGVPVKTIVQVDIPGMTWGIVPMANQFGIKYVFAPFNGSDRVGLAYKVNFRPFWWIGQDGVSKVLFLQPGDYTPGARIKGKNYWPSMAGQRDPDKLLQIVKTDNPRENFIDDYLWNKLVELENDKEYVYDIFPMTWAMADNTPIDADLPEAVKSWNEEYAYPRLIISSSTDIMQAYEKKYGDIIPTHKGDFTEYWTDGVGSAARETSMNRQSKERLIQADFLWSMLRTNQSAPRDVIDEAWRNVLMGSEHTWCYMNPDQADMQNAIWTLKQNFFKSADKESKQLVSSALEPISINNSKIVGVINTLSWKRSELITLSAQQTAGIFSVKDENNKDIPSQRLSTGELVFLAKDVEGLSSKNYYLSDKKTKPSSQLLANGNVLDNGLFKIAIEPETGDIISIIDNSGNEFVSKTDASKVNSFRYLLGSGKPASSGPQYAATTSLASPTANEKKVAATGATNNKIFIKEKGPLLASIVVESKADGCNSLTREVRIIAGKPEIQINNIVDKIAVKEKEGVHFGFAFDVPNGTTKFDIPFGVVELEKDQMPASNRNWLTLQRWLDISNENKGISWCSIDAPNFESGGMTANIIGGANRSPEWITNLPKSSTVYSWALNNHWHTNFPLTQEGKLNFRYRILPHKSAFDVVSANRFGMEQAQPMIATLVKEKVNIKPIIKINNDKVFLSIVKTSKEGKSMIVRLRSVSTEKEKVSLLFPTYKVKSIKRCVADEVAGEEVGNKVEILPNGIVTLIVE